MKNLNGFISIFMMVLTIFPAFPAKGDMLFSYDNGNSDISHWGTKKREHYDVAIALQKSMLDGTILKGVEIPVDGADKMTDVKIWISSDLKDNGSFDDLYSADIDMEKSYDSSSSAITYTFPEPIRIGDYTCIYVGCSFSLTSLSAGAKEPLAVVPGGKNETFIKAASMSTLGKWTDLGRSKGFTSCIRVLIGDARNHAASFSEMPELHLQANNETPVMTSVINHGAEGLSSFRYEGKIGDTFFSGDINLDSPLPNLYGASDQVEIILPAISMNGRYPLELNITRVNDNPNEESSSMSTEANVYSILPVKRPLMEEYTAASCGYCPKGMAAIEIMKERNGDDFIAVSFHTWGDPLDLFPNLPIITESSTSLSLPSAQIDRIITIDPYFGSTKDSFGLDKCWEEKAAQFTTASINLQGSTNDFEASLTSEVTFVNPINADEYSVEFFLIADGLTDPSWSQKNYFSKNEEARSLPGLDKYVDSPGTIKGIVYDDVVVAWSGKEGGVILPAAQEYETLKASMTLPIPAIARNGQLRGVAAVVDRSTGEVLNAIQSHFNETGISSTVSDRQPIETTYWSLQGFPIANPQGICIRVDKLADGSYRTTKTVIR